MYYGSHYDYYYLLLAGICVVGAIMCLALMPYFNRVDREAKKRQAEEDAELAVAKSKSDDEEEKTDDVKEDILDATDDDESIDSATSQSCGSSRDGHMVSDDAKSNGRDHRQ
ncbi:hypothetical protein Pmar_PMAR018417 [Perkinsus marinus ATCC 50983]|uniref:Uncharacterized protein n=1 Tax=Perkinsus marinus (strain ATCC 50983 / TXsc) TaxID=423536 RepID=C5L5V4_PERM5|nr:hypothetical protein Pmar_PMAR018417 [Perkinsus marinus ATCC 50983]EER07889.1 hypothetical protein Pmar_PMAR018417 [Perkinsus marinus ATCC 50983]|eukprot:XP_002776073.1 hypothetical protein Pmar_PMAR018417 [Perkinsus marinus ATCC 50983]